MAALQPKEKADETTTGGFSDRDVATDSANDEEAGRSKPSETTATAANNSSSPRAHVPPARWILTCVGLYTGAMLYGLDTTIAADVQAQVYESLSHIETLPWVGLGFPMAGVAVILALCRAYALFDVKVLTLSSIALFEVGSAVCGAAPTMDALVVGRCIAGVGGAGMYLGALTYFSVFTTQKEAVLYNALTGIFWGLGCILGPVIGGAFSVSSASWRWAFYINLPIAGVLSPIYFFVFPPGNPRRDLTTVPKLLAIDWLGSVLIGATLVLFMIAATFSGSTWAWFSAPCIALWVLFGAALAAFTAQQALCLATSPSHRIFPVHFLRSRTLVALYTATAGAGAVLGIPLYYTPLFFQFTRGDTALQAAVRLLPFICTFIFFVLVAGATLPLLGRYNLYYILGGALITAGGALMTTIDVETSEARIYGYEVLMAAGVGLIFQNAYAVAVAKVAGNPEDVPKAIGYINVAQIGTIAISLAIAGSLFQNLGFRELQSSFEGMGLPDEYVRSALAGTLSPVFQSSDEAIVALAVVAVADTIRRIFYCVVAAGAVSMISGLLMPFEKIDLDMVAGG